jgi:site-specific DNA-methyltransferase (adenine-specific)
MEELIECGSMPGDFVLDPCCGGGSTLIAIRHLKRRGLGIELNQEHYNLAVVAAESDPETKSETEDLA